MRLLSADIKPMRVFRGTLQFVDGLLHWNFAQIGIPIISGVIGALMIALEHYTAAELCFFISGIWGILSLWRTELNNFVTSFDKTVTRILGTVVVVLVVGWIIAVTDSKKQEAMEAKNRPETVLSRVPTADEIAKEYAKVLPKPEPTTTANVVHSRGFVQSVGNPVFGVDELVPETPIRVNISVMNGGSDPIYNVHTLFREIVAPLKDDQGDPDKVAYSWFLKDTKKYTQWLAKNHSSGDTFTPGYKIFATITIPRLTKEQITGIMSGEIRLYVLSWARWKDEPQDYVNCVWLQHPSAAQLSDLVWHLCSH